MGRGGMQSSSVQVLTDREVQQGATHTYARAVRTRNKINLHQSLLTAPSTGTQLKCKHFMSTVSTHHLGRKMPLLTASCVFEAGERTR